LLQAVGEAAHQSCLVLTSRETPPELAVLGSGARALELHGLGTSILLTIRTQAPGARQRRPWRRVHRLPARTAGCGMRGGPPRVL
jgi:hypothetical protein